MLGSCCACKGVARKHLRAGGEILWQPAPDMRRHDPAAELLPDEPAFFFADEPAFWPEG